jgi:PAS domain S-box-containing protein
MSVEINPDNKESFEEVTFALEKSEERYKILVEGIKDYAIFILSPAGFIQSWNAGAEKLNRYTAEQIIGNHFSIFYPQDKKDQGYPEYELEQAKKHGRFEDEGLRVRKDGTTFYANVIITAIYNEKKQLLGFSKITRDLTERKEKEEQIKRSEERYRLLVEGVKEYAIFMLNPEGIITSWNEGAKRLKQYEEHEILGKHFSIFYPQEAKDRRYPEYELEQAKKLGKYEDEGIRIRKDGSTFYANVVITAIYNSDKQLLGFTKITRDLTEKREVEERLRRSEERYRLLVEGAKDYAIFLLDPEGKIISWNEGARRLKQYEEQEVVGKHFSIFYTAEKQKAGYPQYELQQALEMGNFEDEGLRVRKDGSTFYANVVITPLYSSNQLIGFSKITRDLTERKRAEDNLIRLNGELENIVSARTKELTKTVSELKRINSDLDNFIYTASHDLKAPVSNIEGLMHALIKALKSETHSKDHVNRLLEMMNKSIQRFQITIKDLASIHESQRSAYEDKEVIDLPAIIDDVVATIEHIVQQSKAKIEVQTAKDVAFKFSKVHIRSIIYNLLTNAIKYRSPARPLFIQIKSYSEGSFYIIEVTDNGLGIRDENKEKVFDMFKRLHNHVEGSGIGLYILKRIVDNAGGKVEVRSEIDEGTSFSVFLPL